jgi:hypothetical protein
MRYKSSSPQNQQGDGGINYRWTGDYISWGWATGFGQFRRHFALRG